MICVQEKTLSSLCRLEELPLMRNPCPVREKQSDMKCGILLIYSLPLSPGIPAFYNAWKNGGENDLKFIRSILYKEEIEGGVGKVAGKAVS